MVTLDAVAVPSVSVQDRLPRLVAAVELPITSAGSARVPGAVTLRTPAWAVPVMVWGLPAVAAKAWPDPVRIRVPAMIIPVARLSGRPVMVEIEALWNMR